MIREQFYRFAGMEFVIRIPDDLAYTEQRRLAPFAVDTVSDPHVFQFEIKDSLEAPTGRCVNRQPYFHVYEDNGVQLRYIGTSGASWENAHIRAEHRGREHRIQLKASQYLHQIGTKTVLESMAVEHLLARNQGFVFHCSYVDWNGKAILFTAPSETGKSTQADLWNKHRGAEIINGDRAAVRLIGSEIAAEGIPFAGSSQYCQNRSLPLAAIVYLEQAPVSSIRQLRGYEAFSRIWEGCSINTWDAEDMSIVSDIVQQIAGSVPVYHLPCTPDESAVIALETALRK